MRKLSHSILCITISLFYFLLPSKVFAEKNPENATMLSPPQKEQYVITKIIYDITKNILEAALEGKLKLKNGPRQFNSEENFLTYIKNKNAALINIRSLESSSKIYVTKTYNQEKKQHNVVLTVRAKAGFNTLILPYFKYSSNSGLLLSVRGRNYNFLGSLQRLVVDLNYTYDQKGRSIGSINTRFQYPLQMGEKNLFILALAENISYRSDNNFYNKTSFSTRHSYSINPIISWNSLLSQDFISETDLDTTKEKIFSFGKSTFTTGASVLLTPIPLPVIAHIRYTPEISTSFKYSVTYQDPSPEKRYNIIPAINQSLTFGQINEIENFRQGLTLLLKNENSYSIKDETWSNSISAETKLHGTLGSIFGIDARIHGVHNFYTPDPSQKDDKDAGSGIGERLRGVLDDKFKNALSALTINVSVLLKLFSITPFAEFHLGVFSDFGLRKRTGKDNAFSLEKDLKTTLGIEVLSFALFARSIILRVSYGIDLTQVIRDGTLKSNQEIFIGLSRYF